MGLWDRNLVREGSRSVLPESCTCNGFGYDKRGQGIRVACGVHASGVKLRKLRDSSDIEPSSEDELDDLSGLVKGR